MDKKEEELSELFKKATPKQLDAMINHLLEPYQKENSRKWAVWAEEKRKYNRKQLYKWIHEWIVPIILILILLCLLKVI